MFELDPEARPPPDAVEPGTFAHLARTRLDSQMIRLAQPSDVPEIAAVHVRAWQAAYRGHVPDSYLDALDPSQRAAWWSKVVLDPDTTVLVALEATSVVGFCSFLSSRDSDALAGTCEIATLYVDPAHWRSGFGTALVASAIEAAINRGFRAVNLWVLATNSSARAFYESVGFFSDGHSKTDLRLGLSLDEVRYHRNA